jgi:D-glycero-D-manno-heptose 1,7-bisphosphate phosphatase
MNKKCGWAVFLDRDGTINEEVNYLSCPSQLNLISGASEAIQILNEKNIPVIIVTNQSGIARGYFDEKQLNTINDTLRNILLAVGAVIDDIYYCPHHPEAEIATYQMNCDCRKPNPGMLIKAAQKWQLDISHSFLIGDKASDIVAAQRAGCKTILVKSGHGSDELSRWSGIPYPDCVVDNILDAVQWVMSQSNFI